MAEKGFKIVPTVTGTGDYIRFDRGGRILNGWFTCQELDVNGRKFLMARFGDWSTGETHRYRGGDTAPVSKEEQAEIEKASAEADKKFEAAKLARQIECATDAKGHWNECFERGENAYLKRKGFSGFDFYGCRIDPIQQQNLMVPMWDMSGEIWNLQKILPNKPDDGPDKIFKKGGRIHGLFHIINQEPRAGVFEHYQGEIYVCEGLATGISIYEALRTGTTTPVVVCAFNANNVAPVSAELRRAAPQARLVICGDNDRWTTRNNRPCNTGLEAAYMAARQSNGRVAVPFPLCTGNVGDRLTDFNDVQVMQGISEVKKQIEAPASLEDIRNYLDKTYAEAEAAMAGAGTGDQEPASEDTGAGALEPLRWILGKDNKPQKPGNQRVATALLEYFEGDLLKQGDDLWRYVGTHWQLLDKNDHQKIKLMLQTIWGGVAKASEVNDAYQLFIWGVPTAPHGDDLRKPPRMAVNCRNGTIFVTRGADRKWRWDFEHHDREHMMTNVLPYDFDPDKREVNQVWLDWLERAFAGDPDAAAKKRCIAQMYGAALAQVFPRFFHLFGAPGTGKSTVINLVARLVANQNISRVAPNRFHGFHMKGMVNKLVNIDTDIPLDKPVVDDVVKKVVDSIPVQVDRKHADAIDAWLPAIHIFGGNGLPKILDGESGAHERRWTMIKFNVVIPKEDRDQDYWDYIYEASPMGMLWYAMDGLVDRLNEKDYAVSDTGQEAMKEMQQEADTVSQFLADLDDGISDENRVVMRGAGLQIERKKLWSIFARWQEENALDKKPAGKFKVFNTLRDKGIKEKTVQGVRYFEGIGVRSTQSAEF